MFLLPFPEAVSDKQKHKETFPRSHRKLQVGESKPEFLSPSLQSIENMKIKDI